MNFTEVLFAVMILGIGFIMVAAIFPVAIQQSKASTDETVAAAIAQSAVDKVSQIATDGRMDPTASLAAFASPALAPSSERPPVYAITPGSTNTPPELWRVLAGDMLLWENPRFGWMALYSRAGTPTARASVMNTWIVPVQLSSPDRDRYRQAGTAGDVRWFDPAADIPGSSFAPMGVYVELTEGDGASSTGPDTVVFYDGPETTAARLGTFSPGPCAEGAVLIIAHDQLVNDPATPVDESALLGERNGRVYRLGRQTGPDQWELSPGGDMQWHIHAGPDNVMGTSDDYQVTENLPARQLGAGWPGGARPAMAYLVGRGVSDPTVSPVQYSGRSQVLAVHTAVVPIR